MKSSKLPEILLSCYVISKIVFMLPSMFDKVECLIYSVSFPPAYKINFKHFNYFIKLNKDVLDDISAVCIIRKKVRVQ